MILTIFESYLLYFGSFALASFFAALYARLNSIFKYIFFILAIFIPAIVAALRNAAVGTDYQYYLYHISQFAHINSISDFVLLDSNFEIGFNILIFAITRVTDYFPVVVFFIYIFMAFFILLGMQKIISRNYIYLGYLFYMSAFWLFGYNGLRQAIAVAILFFSIDYIRKRELLPFVVTVLFAMSFHKTAILFLPMYYLFNKNKVKIEKAYLMISIVGILFIAFFLKQSSSLIGMDNYLNSQYAQISESSQMIAFLKIIQSLVLLFPFFLWRKKLVKIDNTNRLYYNMLYLYMFVQVISFQVTIASRLGFYFEIVTIPLAMQIISYAKVKKKIINLFYMVYIYLYFIVYKFAYIYLGSGHVIPYAFIGGNI